MAATQAEPPVSEPNMEQDHPPQEMEHGAGLQNGEKNNKPPPGGGGGMGQQDVPMGPKGKMQNNVNMDPSQYRQDPSANPQINNNDQGPNNSEEGSNAENKMYPPPGEVPMNHPYSGAPNYPHPPRGNYHPDMDHMNQMRHGYKPMPRGPGMGPMGGGYPQQRFLSGQSISQPSGPTPTLNQLLQSSNPGGHRFQNRYAEPYSQNWPPPRGMTPYGTQQGPPPPGAFRNQPPLTRGGIPPPSGPSQPPAGPNYNTNAGDQPPASPTNTPYPQRYHTPAARQPYAQHPYAPQPSTPNYDPQQRQQWSAQQSPHPPQAQSPHPPPQASPQSPQHQARPQQASTPNPHAPDPADISGQNSNDSVGATTPNSTNMRPTPSPTSTGGSRSVSPAVGSYGPRPQGSMPQYGAYNTQAPGGPGSQYQYHMQHGQFPGGPGTYQHSFTQGMPPSPSGYPMGPPMGPPGSTPVPNSHPHEPMHPPAPAPNSHVQMHSDSSSDSAGPPTLHDNGYSSPGGGSNLPGSGATSIVTTGPDGTPIDEASQQSTLSNASAASGGDDPSCTPKRQCVPSPNTGMLGPMSWGNRHSNAPNMAPCSPGTAPAMNSMPEEFPPAPAPTWPRAHTSHKHDSLSKLFDMDETPERRHFLDKLLSFMEERGSPITTCPTISKNLLDLFRLYLFVKERGGFLEVCRVNKNKIWKDIAGLLNIGASSSAAYTLRKHYIKNILPFECHFDRGGIDPQPIINQVEASTKKKSAKAAPTVPSPGSSNSQDSFPSSAGGSMDGYGGYGYPPDFNNQRPPSQPPQGYQGQGYPQYPDQYGQQYPPPNRAVYPYGPEGDRNYNQSGPGQGAPPTQPGMPPGAQPNTQDYRGPYMGANQAGYAPRGAYPGPVVNQQTPGTPPAPGSNQQFPANQPNQPPGTPPSQDYFRQDTPRRHPDFAKDQPPPSPQTAQPAGFGPTPGPYPQQRPVYPGWSGNQNNSQYRGSYPPQQWNQGPPRPSAPGSNVPPSPQWESRSYPPNSQQPFPSQQPAWAQNNNMRMIGPRMDVRPPSDSSKPFPPSPAVKPGQAPSGAPSTTPVKREIQFPPDSVEAVTPVLYKRRKLGRSDVAPVEAWRLMMALKSGLLAETCWAIDVLNILLFDDSGIAYFGLSHLPGLLDILLEHFKKSLSDMLESETNADRKWYERPRPDTDIPDLGIPTKTLDEKSAIAVVKSKRNHVESRKKPVSIVESEDLFVLDGPRAWETFPFDNEEPESDTSYIIPCFRAEFGNVPFVRILETKNKDYCPSEKKDASSKAGSCVNSTVQNIVKQEESTDETAAMTSCDGEPNTPKEEKFEPRINDPCGNLKRRRLSDYEDESYCRDEASLYPVSDSQDNVARRCIALSNILRNLTFVPGNELEFAKSATFLRLLGRLILTYHEHGLRATKARNYDRDDENEWADCCSSLSPQAESEWWWDYIESIRENVLVSLANIAGHIDLDLYPEDITRPILDGLLHWAVCPAAQGQDPFASSSCSLSPQRLALEALCKLCVTDNNVDLVIATPPYSRLERLTYVLTRFLCKNEDQVLREFAVNLLHYLAAADSAMSRTIALQSPCISLLVAFIEQAEQNALGVANQHGIGALRDNPDTMGTSLDMLRRTARTLLHLSKHPDNKSLFIQQEQRLLALVMSQILDQQVAAIISRVLYQTRPDLYQNR